MRIHEAALIITCETTICLRSHELLLATVTLADIRFSPSERFPQRICLLWRWQTFIILCHFKPDQKMKDICRECTATDVGWTHLLELPSTIVRPFLFAVLLQICSVLSNLIRAGLASPTGTKWHLVCRAAVDHLGLMSEPGLPRGAARALFPDLPQQRPASRSHCWRTLATRCEDNEEFWDPLRPLLPAFAQNGVWRTLV